MSREDFGFFWPFRVRYSEVDRQGIAYNAHYLTWFDVALWEFFKALPWDCERQIAETGSDFHTVKATVEYRSPALFDQDIEVGVAVARLGRSSVSFSLALFPAGQGEVLARGEVVWVNADQASRRSTAIPGALRPLLAAATR